MRGSDRRRPLLAGLCALMCLTAVSYGVCALARSRDVQLFGKIIPRVETREMLAALTFDDGPAPEHLAGVLDVLRLSDIRATFFLTGRDIDAYPSAARAIVAAGHEIGNHTYTHSDMTFASEQTAEEEITRTDAAIRRAGYTGAIHVRPPYGRKLIGLPPCLARSGRATMTWDVEPESDPERAGDPEQLAAFVTAQTRPGSIINMHVMYDSREAPRQALPAIIDGLEARGSRLVTLSDLMAAGDRRPAPRIAASGLRQPPGR